MLETDEEVEVEICTGEDWVELGKSVKKSKGSYLVSGDKNTGKSTLICYLLSQNSNCILLDLDVGQPIFDNPGTIKAYSFTKTKSHIKVTKTHEIYIGELSPEENELFYIESVKYLVSKSISPTQGKVLVNYCGYSSGPGNATQYAIMQACGVDHIISILKGQNECDYVEKVRMVQKQGARGMV